MATEDINIVLAALWKGKSAIQAAQRDVGGLEKKVKSGIDSLGGVAGIASGAAVALGTVAVASKVAWDSLNKGAELEAVKFKFDNLTASIGTTSDALLNDMKVASNGMVSGATLMAGANDLMQSKLATSHDAVVRLSAVSSQLNWDMGVLAQTINNQSVLRLDNLGLAVSDVIPRFQELKAAGMDVKAAFTQALIEAGEKSLGVIGSEADTLKGKIQQIQVVVQETGETFYSAFAESAVSSIEATAGSIQDLGSDINTLADAVGTLGGMFVGMFARALVDAINLGNTLKQLTSFEGIKNFAGFAGSYMSAVGPGAGVDPRNLFRAYNDPSYNNGPSYRGRGGGSGRGGALDAIAEAEATKELTAAQKQSALERQKVRNGVYDMLNAMNQEALAVDAAAAANDNLSGSFGNVKDSVTEASEQMHAFAAATGDFFVQARNAKDFNPFESLFQAANKYGANALQLADIGVGGGLFDQSKATEYLQRTALMQRADTAAQLLASGQISSQEAVSMIQNLQKGFDNGLDVADEFFANLNAQEITPEMLLNTDNAWQDYVAIKTLIEKNPPVVYARVVYQDAAGAERVRNGDNGGGGFNP